MVTSAETSALGHESLPQGEMDGFGFWTLSPPWEELQTGLRSYPNLPTKTMLFYVNQTGKLLPILNNIKMGGNGNRKIPVFAHSTCSSGS